MADPLIDLSKLKSVKDWAEDLSDELTREDVLPCKNIERLGDCLTRQKRYLIEEMKPSKMCIRCLARWYSLMTSKLIGKVYAAKTETEAGTKLNWT